VAAVSKLVQKLERQRYIYERGNNAQNNTAKMAELIDTTIYCTERVAQWNRSVLQSGS